MKKVLSSWRTEHYKTSNWSQCNTALRQRGSLTIWFDPSIHWGATPNNKPGCQQKFSDAAIRTCLMLKVLFRLPLRQTKGLVASVLELAGLDWDVPDLSGLCIINQSLPTRCPTCTLYHIGLEPGFIHKGQVGQHIGHVGLAMSDPDMAILGYVFALLLQGLAVFFL